MTQFIYLHGFASGPGSKKASVFKKRFDQIPAPLTIPDLQGEDFRQMTLSTQIKGVTDCMDRYPGQRFGLIGSSMGGYVAALTAQFRTDVAAMYLMAPGFNFLKRWRERLSSDPSDPRAVPSVIRVFHYRYNRTMELDAGIFQDAERWEKLSLNRELPTRVVHGLRDETVDIAESRKFAQDHPWCRLKELDAPHDLISHLDWIVADCLEFFHEEDLF